MSALWLQPTRELERVEQRVLGALRCVDATTGAPVPQPLRIEAPAGARIQHNRSGLFVVKGWAPMLVHSATFLNAPTEPPLGAHALQLVVHDPFGEYLSRRVRMALPRDADPANAHSADSLFRPLEVPMYPARSARVGANWAALGVSVRDSASGDALGGVLLRVVSTGRVLARGLSDWRGEAAVPVAGIPVTTWSAAPGDVIVTQIEATLEAIADPDVLTRTPQPRVAAGRAPTPLPLVDPAAIEAARAGLPQASVVVSLAAGRPLHVSLAVPLP